RTIGDPHFGAVEDVAVPLLVGAGAHRYDVRARTRLRHGERADMGARNQFRQIALLLVGAAIPADLVHAEIGMRAVGKADRAGSARNLLHGHAMFEIAEAGPAPFLFNRDAEQPELAELRPQIAREFVFPVDLVGARRDLALREAAHAV